MTVRPTLPSVAARKRRPAPTAMLGSELERLHRHYSTTGDQAARAALVEAYAHLAGSLAARFQGRAQSPDDLLQAAMVGLLHALDRFDPDRGAEFTTFAWATISGELKRLLRDRSWALRLPRRLQESSLRTTDASAALTAELG
ncbi:MAG: sigma-70 family RNA polymerase sigma factor, partial [Acidimicrobiales bacterium]